jgi:hypothetical protein
MSARHIAVVSAMVAGLSMLGAAGPAAAGTEFFAVLNGGNEVGPSGQAAAGDPDGRGTASVVLVDPRRLCFSILVDDIDAPVMAHIHENVAGQNGPIVVNLIPPPAGNPGASSRCLGNLDPAVLLRIRVAPHRFYINVHTGIFPAGAVRGQLF